MPNLWPSGVKGGVQIFRGVFVCVSFFRDAPMACGDSQARDRIRAVAANLHHSHSKAGSLTHWAKPGIAPVFSGMPIRFVSAEPWKELPHMFSFKPALLEFPSNFAGVFSSHWFSEVVGMTEESM